MAKLKVIKNTVKRAVDKIRTSKAIDRGEEMLITAVLPVIVRQISQGATTLSPEDANKYAKEIVKGLNQLGNKVLGEVVAND